VHLDLVLGKGEVESGLAQRAADPSAQGTVAHGDQRDAVARFGARRVATGCRAAQRLETLLEGLQVGADQRVVRACRKRIAELAFGRVLDQRDDRHVEQLWALPHPRREHGDRAQA